MAFDNADLRARDGFTQKKVTILQIGDIHYPDQVERTANIDVKSDPFGAKNVLAPRGNLFQDAVRMLVSEAQKEIEAIVFVGDLTTGGDIQGFETIAKMLANDILPLFFKKAEFSNHVIIVPGNHDVDWPTCLDKHELPDDFTDKFKPFADILSREGLYNFPLLQPCSLKIGGDIGINLFGISAAQFRRAFVAIHRFQRENTFIPKQG